MKGFLLPLVVWLIEYITWIRCHQGHGGIGYGIKRDIFFLNLEDGYFGCQVNQSTDVLQLYELSRLCDGISDCYRGTDELARELKCSDTCISDAGIKCENGACLDSQCHCNDGFGGCSCEVPDENECKYRPCDVFAHCTNTLGSFHCSCFPGYTGDGFHCQDVNECEDASIARRCVANAECCNVPAHFVCKCKPGFVGDGEVECRDVDECGKENACGHNAICHNLIGNYTCDCKAGYAGNPFHGCADIDECALHASCGRGALCTNFPGGYHCECPAGSTGDAYKGTCVDINECALNPCGHNAICNNIIGSYQCLCPPGFVGDAYHSCTAIGCASDSECPSKLSCISNQCQNLCQIRNPCDDKSICQIENHKAVCLSGREPSTTGSCNHCPPGVPCDLQTGVCAKVSCLSDASCPINEVCIQGTCQYPCSLHNPCVRNAACVNTNHGIDCSCLEGYQGNAFVECLPVPSYQPVCQYNEDCPPDKLCDRLNRVCINPCFDDSCGENADCVPKNHGIECRCLPGFSGNPYLSCNSVTGCRHDDQCATTEACINGKCSNPCKCGPNALCEVIYHKPSCKCPPGYGGNPNTQCTLPENPCKPNPCGIHALCEIDDGSAVCFCPKGMTGNPFKQCIPEGEDCVPNPCGENSGCRVVQGSAVCFCLPEFEGDPPITACRLPSNPCHPSPCGPNTFCTILPNGFAKCTCLQGYIESPNTVRGCVSKRNPCDPNPCGHRAICDPNRNPSCFCPDPLIGNPYKLCGEPVKSLCQPGPCGHNADCYIAGSVEQCYCKTGYQGDPFVACKKIPTNPCVPNPCGPYSQCTISRTGEATCSCPPGIMQDTTTGICSGLECTVDEDCALNKACIAYRCQDPCAGCCGVGASCRVEKHHPVCTCSSGLTGNPLVRCYLLDLIPAEDPCKKNSCGVNSYCKVVGKRPVCSCIENFVGDPRVGCYPQCVLNTDCNPSQVCSNYQCKDPCSISNVCGLGAVCLCRDHTPTCICREGFTGNPFVQCVPHHDRPTYVNTTLPCVPSPCDPHSQCNVYGDVAMCDPCSLPSSQYNPECHPECLYNTDCPFNLACLGQKCRNPCPGSCGINAHCIVVHHGPVCSCPETLTGDPYQHCSPIPPTTQPTPAPDYCHRNRCGANAICKNNYGHIICECPSGYHGNPYLTCQPECVLNTDCNQKTACINNKCVNPCNGVCGVNAQCQVVNHLPVCFCANDYIGDPFINCYPQRPHEFPPMGKPGNPCDPSPCGSYSRCLISHQGYATCSCLPGYLGSPPYCRPECSVSAECSLTEACINWKCVDPCPGTCGVGAHCSVINHNPICSCPAGHVGDPFIRCLLPPGDEHPKIPDRNPCNPSPCGPNSICQVRDGHPVCSCIANYFGSPPYCRPECVMNQECPFDKACIKEKCVNPCDQSCGLNAKCDVVKHRPYCACLPGYEGDAFVACSKIPPPLPPMVPKDPCYTSPCGENSQCTSHNGVAQCICIPPYIGNPYVGGCHPECVINSDCSPNTACLSSHCRDPCPGVCGINAECTVVNHIPVCSCLSGHVGDPFRSCRPRPAPSPPVNPCDPSPCGPNSVCKVSRTHAICSCNANFIGAPPNCRPECVVSAECLQNLACISQKCSDPCPGTCGLHARCTVINHNPICTCPPNTVGDPFVRCLQREEPREPLAPKEPCEPSPCGINSECKPVNGRAVCSCLPGMLGIPPYCRPECFIHADCPTKLACLNNKCRNPCVGSCGFNAECSVVNHQPVCRCAAGFKGDPFNGCNPVPATQRTPVQTEPCFPSPCGTNAECINRNGAAACKCAEGFFGDPYSGCRRECESNLECGLPLACIGYKCVDPCPGTCGIESICTVVNHIPVCSCPPGYSGDPFFSCRPVPVTPTAMVPRDPCYPSPCGPNSQCRQINSQAVCTCLTNYQGSPPNCRPECVVSSECPSDRACINQRCLDPCPNTCGSHAQCTVKNHNPFCSCPPQFSGDPFFQCLPIPVTPLPPTEAPPSCVPSPCGPNSQCKMISGSPVCSCLPDYIGSPPSCRPECILSAECLSQLACINQHCRDPCPGSCGANANCHVLNHVPICTCNEGHTGDPFTLCNPIPIITPRPQDTNPCQPSPCGPNAICHGDGICECLPDYSGNPYESCRPQCVISADCPRDKACIRNKCHDPCEGTCGQNAKCDVINHIPVCSCSSDFVGDPFTLCRPKPQDLPPKDPCSPSPCGPNSQCRYTNGHAVCSCLSGYSGSPPSCRPECIVSGECSAVQACVNMKCVNPCVGVCGLGARCEVINHSPICSCREGQTGDPFRSCYDIPPIPVAPESPPSNPCVPSPCGPNSRCQTIGNQPSCSCLQGYVGAPPACRPECVSNSDCSSNQVCVNNKCRNPCPESCGINAQCQVISHTVSCICMSGYVGNPFEQCTPQQQEPTNPCEPSPCGANAVCKQQNGAGSCSCIPDYHGNPYEGCRPECVLSSDCLADRACIRNKCLDPCIGVCGTSSTCSVINHVPTCNCIPGYEGNPFSGCRPIAVPATQSSVLNPCSPSPCGPNSNCKVHNGQSVCSCQADYLGSPPDCRPECVVSSECPPNRACYKLKCTDPCPGTCGLSARCEVVNHHPICSCPSGFTGDPFSRCYMILPPPLAQPVEPVNPCVPSPCGPNSECQVNGKQASCRCRENFIGQPPNCRPECVVNTDCLPTLACISDRCRDPCIGSCGLNAECHIQNHIPICSCIPQYTGDPFTQCSQIIEQRPSAPIDPCNPSPCGANANCKNGLCTCVNNYFGDAYVGCRPECTTNAECTPNKACINQRCVNPCIGTCGQNAGCDVVNHIPTCTCPPQTAGDAFVACHPVVQEPPKDLCNPSPCGPNSICRVVDGHAVCSCQPGLIGSPPSCKQECIVSAECPLVQACLMNKCKDPCPGTCGLHARCQVVNHNPICSCPQGFTGDPFRHCHTIPAVPSKPADPTNPCVPSPCGPNAVCQQHNESPACSCLANYIGAPPNCRPECTINPECPSNLACNNQRCTDPCAGSCGSNAVCSVVNHIPVCSCTERYTGDPFSSCSPIVEMFPQEKPTPCTPSPCGHNALCKEQNGAGSCSCINGYSGNPYLGCRPECISNSECSSNKACIQSKCVDPCPGTCSSNAECFTINHAPSCICRQGYTGDPMRYCSFIPDTPTVPEVINPCVPSPCGPYSKCRNVNQQAVCSCLPTYIGSPPSCKPECLVSSECDVDRACVNQKCVDPCVGTCGLHTQCRVHIHSPICVCLDGYTGDPFSTCYPVPTVPVIESTPTDPCVPSPCGPYSQCQQNGNIPSCSCLPNYIGLAPNCRPECTINSECRSSDACINQKCRDPCPGSCGIFAQCHVYNHIPICTCEENYIGDPFTSCTPKPPQVTEPPLSSDPCYPSPCGSNTQCNAGVCSCLPEYQGDPYVGCRPECVINNECPAHLACITQKCRDPCIETCGQNAVCNVYNHIPICSCPNGMSGNAFIQCIPHSPPVELNPCNPSPCGPNSKCREYNGQAVCSCVSGFVGSPPSCRPECVVNSDCIPSKSCSNQKCQDTCPGTCGIGAKCSIINHNPICSCPSGFTGDPFVRCQYIPPAVQKPPDSPVNPCIPSPCGHNAHCKVKGDTPSCSCLPDFIGIPPHCKPECISNSECPLHLACINQKCKDPCPGSCGLNAECNVVSHSSHCSCLPGYTGNPFAQCNVQSAPIPVEHTRPCEPSPCGANAICKEQNGAGSCSCLPDYQGNPYEGCRPECISSIDCVPNKACIRNKCIDPCPGTCGPNAQCQVVSHVPSCTCLPTYTGDPFRYCSLIPQQQQPQPTNPCRPSPCGPNSQCKELNGQPICSCLAEFVGSPPGCRPECVVNSECHSDRACVNQKCINPCASACGHNTNCKVIHHNPICSCIHGYTGDPFSKCYQIPPSAPVAPPVIINPCVPSPCGAYSQCREVSNTATCSCLPNYIGSPPNCRPECTINSECSNQHACIQQKCQDPCPGSCGLNAVCNVFNHIPTCTCIDGYIGDPFSTCSPKPIPQAQPTTPIIDPCDKCGYNTQCKDGKCTCLPEYEGDAYVGCRPECIINNECPINQACIKNRCRNPCIGTCGLNADCSVYNHIPICSCPTGMSGNPFSHCQQVEASPLDVCRPSPCGPNSQCKVYSNQAVCSCIANFIGSPPSCRPECVVNSDCQADKACSNQKCRDPCPGTCGISATCQVINHNAICTCRVGYTGDPFTRCQYITPVPIQPDVPVNPCVPSPCGPNSQCQVKGSSPSCSCLPEFIGVPPSCKPECVTNSECSSHLVCLNRKCRDPCPGLCADNAECRVISHSSSCLCLPGYTGNPFVHCSTIEQVPPPIEHTTPCIPSPCGINAVCKEHNGAGSCTCLPEYQGNPYEGCRPECTVSTDCPSNKACIRNKCLDPCPGTCGANAECQVVSHIPSCTCLPTYTGDPFKYCTVIHQQPSLPIEPCRPSPCGPNSQCKPLNGQAICFCLPSYLGSPPSCRPECVVNTECPRDQSCVNRKCSNPCIENTCGQNSNCRVINHNPICSCSVGFTGDPFVACYVIPAKPTDAPTIINNNPCQPSPCGPYSICQEHGSFPSCSCIHGYIGTPPTCHPECIMNSECPSNLACIKQKCRDPCIGSCGLNSQCSVYDHSAICTCTQGYTGDPFTNCHEVPQTPVIHTDPCNPSPCGPNAICKNGECFCEGDFHGDGYTGCRPECLTNEECQKDKACLKYKCTNPCIGVCGFNALCQVTNHIPMCSCPLHMSGNPFTNCHVVDAVVEIKPCTPSPCGPNSQCREYNGQAVCSCLVGFIGSPPSCRPECTVHSDCALNEACYNYKCIDPCPGTCGFNAKCRVINHNPICSCPHGYTGDPFTKCYYYSPVTPQPDVPVNPCIPTPCGPNSECRINNNEPSCSCLTDYIGYPPNCKPECVSNGECPSNKACINQKCKDPCLTDPCGLNAECHVYGHMTQCSCTSGYGGNPFLQCDSQPPIKEETTNPCSPSPCGENTICKEHNGAGSCICLPEYYGNPYEGCRPECVVNTDCAPNKACIRYKCVDPCPGTCGPNAECRMVSHVPSCSCLPSYTGNPFTYCTSIPAAPEPVNEPCIPSPCGPNSKCREVNGQAICSCLPTFVGSAPSCRPECVVSAECPYDRTCDNHKCVNPCPSSCGSYANCRVINHNAICSCQHGYTGDPFTFCYPAPTPSKPAIEVQVDPCVLSPCGPFSQCRNVNGIASCSCAMEYIGIPPNCRPECSNSQECSSDKACINEKCRDACIGSCGVSAICNVFNHIPMCSCPAGYTGDPFVSCYHVPPTPPPTLQPSPSDDECARCGINAICKDGSKCVCISGYHGDAYTLCRPECTVNEECEYNKACIRNKCMNPCEGSCASSAICQVVNHVATCICPGNTTGNPFVYCRAQDPIIVPSAKPCSPSPCGPNSKCIEHNSQAICTCLPSYIGTPPSCRPQCITSSQCPLNEACINQRCIDPCPGTCGLNAQCKVHYHNPICTCPSYLTGDPFTRCYNIPSKPAEIDVSNPCVPSPCGPNSICQVQNGISSCSCLPDYIGNAPNCRPECVSNMDCSWNLACMNQKCRDPCIGSCGLNSECHVTNHIPNCICNKGYIGDPFTNCYSLPQPSPSPATPQDPCYPSPCGPNARCRIENTWAVCECISEYQGNPYEGCRPECIVSSDCPMNKACIRNKCKDPCPGTCGFSAICSTSNHIAVCYCPEGTTGDAFRSCQPIPAAPAERHPTNPCVPSPCGPNTRCQVLNNAAICECLASFQGSPATSGCRPECVISSDCPRNRACENNKCIDPCPGVCGYKAICQTINHSPICSCPAPTVGNPFSECKDIPEPPVDPCNPSPCRQNGQCRVVGTIASCTYPECVINQDCSRDKACYNQKCQDPCVGACGINAICQVANHDAVCSCPAGFYGQPSIQCIQQAPPQPVAECTSDSECLNDKACINTECKDPCSTTTCAQNSDCRVQQHRPFCFCKDSMTGDGYKYCYEIGCKADSDCLPQEACVNRQCIDPCAYTQCGENAVCRVDVNHKARCYCPDSYVGNALIKCERPQCLSHDDCPSYLVCNNQRCQDPCNCGENALCSVVSHVVNCRCPPGYTGNPHTSCVIAPITPTVECKMDADCPSKLACFSSVCKNPCVEAKPCGPNAECTVVDSLPLRTMTCQCLPGYVGDADVQCKLVADDIGCKSVTDCASTEVCVNRQCVSPCVVSNPCATNALCHTSNHKATCSCPAGLIGDPFTNCYKVPPALPECSTDSDCPNIRSCINERCQDPCAISNPCGTYADCLTVQHRPVCNCPDGWAGTPQVHCYKPECKADSDCVYDKSCLNGNCVSPCASMTCGVASQCIVQAHQAQCICPTGTQGNPLVSCVSVACQYNEDCPDDEACDRLNRKCRPVCEQDTCAELAICTAKDHQPSCACLPGKQGDPYVECTDSRIPGPSPECTKDPDCGPKHACINRKCENPCRSSSICSPDQECQVLDTIPVKTVMCVCPPDTIATNDGHCKPIVAVEPQCHVDNDCANTDRCVRGGCIEACKMDPCGLNSICKSYDHQAICNCPIGYIGNPYVECINAPTIPMPPSIPQCTRNDDCSNDLTCVNERCVNPCYLDNPCALGALCHVEGHKPICHCPIGYLGDATISCNPPVGSTTIACKTNDECTLTESCINQKCINPCSCGPNSECKVQDHYPICYCKQGYYGNPQLGCIKVACESDDECNSQHTCYNGECVNPCILQDVCGVNAQCYGLDHKATCKCAPGYIGNAYEACQHVECHIDVDCPNDKICSQQRCLNPCDDFNTNPCAHNAICYVNNHATGCACPQNLPIGNPLLKCDKPPSAVPNVECHIDADCPSKLACIGNRCLNPCVELQACSETAKCNVLDSSPVRTITCTCPEGWVPNTLGQCRPVIIGKPPGCIADSDCSSEEACINRLCRNPCDCGTNAECHVRDHRPVCSCKQGYEGNANVICKLLGCRRDSECESGKSCINGNCVNGCILNKECGLNAECYTRDNKQLCRCLSGYRGNAYDVCHLIECRSNSDCPDDRSCINAQCINPCTWQKPCAQANTQCTVKNHMALCRCAIGTTGNPYHSCVEERKTQCTQDSDCPSILACLNNKCENPCTALEPCEKPAECVVEKTLPVRTMICVCPTGYISSGSGTCKPIPEVKSVACTADEQCPSDKACVNGICIDPCDCAFHAQCFIKNHKPVCSCLPGYDGNPNLQCVKSGCKSNTDCPGQDICENRICVPACASDGSSCGTDALCYGVKNRAVCECPPGLIGNAQVACILVTCKADSDCPSDRACINKQCVDACSENKECEEPSVCVTYNHKVQCICPPGYRGNVKIGCEKVEKGCRSDSECPSQTACINELCVNPCKVAEPCGTNAVCKVTDTVPVRTMVCQCLPGYQGNAAVNCVEVAKCPIEKGFIRDEHDNCVCPPGMALNYNEECRRCVVELGYKVDESGHCVCALERGLIINERGQCICPLEHGYILDIHGNCVPVPKTPGCDTDDDCADDKYCETTKRVCLNPCDIKECGVNAKCNATHHIAICVCPYNFYGNADVECKEIGRKEFPKAELMVTCLSDGIQVRIELGDSDFNGVLYVKGHSKEEECRRVITSPSVSRIELFKVLFGDCGLIHVNGQASFVLVIQKHPKLVTYRAQAYHIKCVYQTSEQNVTIGFNVSMLTTAGTIANTGPPPTCLMKIITQTGQEINSAEIGENLMLQVDVHPSSIYGGFARSCVAKTTDNNVENEYIVTDENGCATDPTVFGEWQYNADTQSLIADFNAFKFPSSDNIRFQCNIRVCFGKCQPVNCAGYNAYGKRRRRRDIDSSNNTDIDVLHQGQLREEITIESNAIFTFERKEERLVNPTEQPQIAGKMDDICISLIWLILSLVITALLALVAVAVATSCWLLAYRRQPSMSGPLPHPPEFPNPIFSSPEITNEPSPDYLS